MPSGHEDRMDQQRARREALQEKFPWDSPGDLQRRAKNKAQVHKSRVAGKIKALIMSDGKTERSQLDNAMRHALEKFPSLVDFEYRKCLPTFQGMPSMFAEMETRSPQRVMRDMRRARTKLSWSLKHMRASIDSDADSCLTEIIGYESQWRKDWPDYRRTPFSVACAFDRTEMVRMLVVQFHCNAHAAEQGLVLVDQHGTEHEWCMTGFDLAVEFGCLATLDLLCELSATHPHVIESIAYVGISHEDCRALCTRNVGNRLQPLWEPAFVIRALELYTNTRNDCDCDFCTGNK